MPEKRELRRELLRLHRGIRDKSAKDAAMFRKLVQLPEFERAELVLTYASTETEADTFALIHYCFEKGVPLAIPGIVDEEMRFFRLNGIDNGWEIDVCQLPEVDYALAVVPALAYNKDNNRLGYGGGYYDRFLRGFRGYKVGLCYREFILDIPVEKHDEKVDIVITD